MQSGSIGFLNHSVMDSDWRAFDYIHMSDLFEIVSRRFYIGKSINLMLDWLVLTSNQNTQLKNRGLLESHYVTDCVIV